MRKVLGFALVVVFASACGSKTPTAPSRSFTVSVTSANSMVFFNNTEQMTATASDGKPITGSWNSDNTDVATVSSTGSVTPVGAGQATIIFRASSGEVGTKLLRMVPNLGGTFAGRYTITSCQHNGFLASVNFCGTLTGSLPFTLNFSQSNDAISGRFFLGSNEFDNAAGTIDNGGNVTVTGLGGNSGILINAKWDLSAPRPSILGGSLTQLWTSTIIAGQGLVSAQITSVNKTARLPRAIVPQSAEDLLRAMREP